MRALKYIAVYAILLLHVAFFAVAQPLSYYESAGFRILRSDDAHLVLSYKPVVERLDTIVTSEGMLTVLPVIRGASLADYKPGAPSMLQVSVPLAVPGPERFKLRGISAVKNKYLNVRIAPVPEIILKNDVWVENYRIDEDAYASSGTSLQGKLEYNGIARNVHLAQLTINVAEFDSKLQRIRIPEEILVSISFDKSVSSGNKAAVSDFPEFVINGNIARKWLINTSSSFQKYKKTSDNRPLALSGGIWIKLSLEKEGIYKIDASDLASLGFTIPKEQVATIKIFGNDGKELSEKVSDASNNKMNEIPIIVRTDGNGNLQSIIFYGAATEGFIFDGTSFKSWFNHYSDKNYYLLTWGGDEGKRVEAGNAQGSVENKPLTYIERIFYKEELSCALVGGSGRVWFGGSLFPRAFTNQLYNLDRSKEIFYRFNFAHRSDQRGKFTITESGQKILDGYLPSTATTSYLDGSARTFEISVPADNIPGDNRSLLNITYKNSNIAGSTPFFNWYEIHYSRNFVPIDNSIGFWTEPSWQNINEFSINGFSGSEIFGFEVTDPAKPIFIENEAITGGMFVFKYDLEDAPKRFYISARLEKPEMEVTTFANLREKEGDAEVILVTHPNFMPSAEYYKSYRKDRKIEIVSIKDIINEFNAGLPDPTALRDYLAFLMNTRTVKPRYVILWGDGHYDYKNIQTKVTNYILTYQSFENNEDFYATHSYTSDDYFAWVVGNDRLIDFSIARIPIGSDKEGKWMVDKIKLYENAQANDDWTTHIMLLADDSPTSNGRGDGATHTNQSETLAAKVIPEYMYNKKIYLPEYPSENIPNGRRKPRVTEEMVSFTNNYGTLLMNWIGHGNPRVWAHEEIFNRDKTVVEFKNLNRLFFNTAATCDFARWDMPETQSGAEVLLLAKNGGSIGEFSSTRLVYSYDNSQINQLFYFAIFSRDEKTKQYPPLGDAMFSVKQRRTKINDIKFNLLADPLIRLKVPYYMVRVESINKQTLTNPADTAELNAMSKVEVKASVINPVDSAVVSDFNGYSKITMFDSDYRINIEDVDGTIHKKLNYGGILNRGSFPVENGKINASFYIPEDISFMDAPGRLYVFAMTDDKRQACGITRQFKLTGVDSINFDADKPKVSVFLDSIAFKPGDIVSNPPMLIVNVFDEYGVNTSGSGIGHRLEAWIDDSPYAIDLTNHTYISPENSNLVEARKLLNNLSPGIHKIKVRAWNVFNKYSVAETEFRILSGDEGAMIWDVMTYPNPTTDNVTLRFRHNMSHPFIANVKIYNSSGQLVKEINTSLSSVYISEIKWDGTDFEGSKVAQDVYVMKIELNTLKGMAYGTAGAVIVR
jgi:hypothetical protein